MSADICIPLQMSADICIPLQMSVGISPVDNRIKLSDISGDEIVQKNR
jgi:hypothetical protein